MQYRIDNDTLIPAPLNFRTPDGRWIMNFNHSPELMTEYGFTMTEAEAEAWREQHPEPEPVRNIFTKLAIRRAMRELNIEAKLDALLNASSQFRADWNDAQEIDLADPVLLDSLKSGSITAEEITAIKAVMNRG